MRHLQRVQVHFEPDRMGSDRLRKAYEVVVEPQVRTAPDDADVDRRRVNGGMTERKGLGASSEPDPIHHGLGARSVEEARPEAMGAADASGKVPLAPSQHGARHAA